MGDYKDPEKTPKRVLSVRSMFRAPNGKPDYQGASTFARSQLGA